MPRRRPPGDPGSQAAHEEAQREALQAWLRDHHDDFRASIDRQMVAVVITARQMVAALITLAQSAQKVAREAARHKEWLATPSADIFFIKHVETPQDVRDAALQRIAEQVARGWRVREPSVRWALRDRAASAHAAGLEKSRFEVKREAVMEAALVVVRTEMQHPPTRRSSHYRWYGETPEEIDERDAVRWIINRIKRVARASLLEERSTLRAVTLDERTDLLQQVSDQGVTSLYALVECSECDALLDQAEPTEQWDNMPGLTPHGMKLWTQVWHLASGREQELLLALYEEIRVGGTQGAAARAIGMAEGTAKYHMNQLRQKLA